MPADPAAVSDARAWATRQLAAWGLDALVITTELIVSELASKAIRYGRPPAELRLIRHHVLVCEVTDSSSAQPRLRRARTTDEGGRVSRSEIRFWVWPAASPRRAAACTAPGTICRCRCRSSPRWSTI
ncbi:ATP-binding protein [Streptomyces sp. NPDC001307]|uniref:ATP-binding protein n=1 Tax=Streptomyces sp. NPDC001307 TaxID=3364560 RepID=UPI00369FB416